MVNNQDVSVTCIRHIREESGISIKEVALDLSLNARVLQEIETGKKGTNAKRAFRIAMYFGKPMEDLFIPMYYRAKPI
ncbi:helix-turn-helix transcriptional regulator [Bacillus cereus]|uniref:XRE family transcriptional regulator n=1 Tax=Bacillus cereus TaxID=1396 RepID=A0A9X7M0H8_BACCE|nr:helix-turn-helix transcriptional regulator [Bacillus cereus]MDA2637886.1 helix-turn-helix transcriptional regulator [Bacillus cereus]QDZ76624.1 XRE family transcriptional regulator [Bacillus cereus]